MDALEFKQKMLALPPLTRHPELGTWERNCWGLRQEAKHSDCTYPLTWPTMKKTMVVGGDAAFVQEELAELRGNPDWNEWWWWEPTEEGEWVCGEQPLLECPNATADQVHQAYHLSRWEKATGKYLFEDVNSIVEIGGGYGAMALICRQLEYDGPYTIVDLPEVSLIQQYYLSQVGLLDGMKFVTTILDAPAHPDLLIACWSLSEMETHGLMAMDLWFKPKSYLIAYQADWRGRDNNAFFEAWPKSKPEYEWVFAPAAVDSTYLFGWRKDAD